MDSSTKDISRRRPGKLTKGVLFHQDNPAHKSAVDFALTVHGFELVNHLPYSPDLAPSDYFLFPNKKKQHLAGKQYRTDEEAITAVEGFFEDQDDLIFYTTQIQALQQRWKKCMDRRRDYIEK